MALTQRPPKSEPAQAESGVRADAALGPGGVAALIVLALVALAGVAGAIANPEAVGLAGLAFLIAVTLTGAGFLIALAGMRRGAAAPDPLPLMLSEAIRRAPDPCAVTKGQALVFANAAYRTLARAGEGEAPVAPPYLRVNPEMAGRLYRLSRAARRGDAASEELRLVRDGAPRALFVTVEPLSAAGLAVWWFRGKPGPALALAAENVVAFAPPAQSQAFAPPPPAAPALPEPVPEPVMLTSEQTPSLRAAAAAPGTPYAEIFAQAPVGMALIGGDGKIAEANDAFARVMGASEADALPGKALVEHFKGDDRSLIAARLDAARAGEAPLTPLDVRLPSDRAGHLYVRRLDGAGRAIVTLIDATEQKQLDVRVSQAQKLQALGQMAGGVAHDFNNLLTAIIGYCDLLLARHRVGDPSYSDLDRIRQNANRAANLVRQLLAFSRKQTLQPKVLNMSDVLSEVKQLCKPLVGENVAIELDLARDLGPVKADAGQLENAVINLAVNARDAMKPNGGRIVMRTANVAAADVPALGHALMPAADYVMIEVSDTGAGIPPEIIGKIFDPFFTTKAQGEGTGLGLSTVYGIVKQTGGFIFPHSEPGKGAAFRIYLPRYAGPMPAANEDDARQPLKDLTGMGTILLAEDEDAVRGFAARALKTRGYTVLEASDGESALNLVKSHQGPIHLLITDVVMPGMDGPTLVKEARPLRPDMRIVFISGYAEDAFRKSGGHMEEEFDFLPKPFGLKDLAAKVKDVLNG